MTLLPTVLGKLVLLALRLIGRGGNAVPGLVIEKTFPRYLARVLATLPQGVTVISGTNGKTTTTNMVTTILERRYRVLTNDTGSNMLRGVIAACITHADWRGRLDYDVAVLEVDEGWTGPVGRLAPPRRMLLLNVMRDQLDRYGEIDATARMLADAATLATDALVLNRDDPRIAALAERATAKVSYYGVAPELRAEFPNDEELYGGPLYRSEEPAVAELRTLPAGSPAEVTLRIDGVDEVIALRAEGPHNAQNAAGAAALALTFGLTPAEIADGLRRVDPVFGRGQTYDVDGRRVVLHLTKNPAGFRQTLRGLDTASPAGIVVAINDSIQDGRDVSWLWDVDFAPLRAHAGRLATSGVRAADMAVRLRYDDIAVDAVTPDPETAVRDAVAAAPPGAEVIVYSTYTAMWALHAILLRIGAER